MARTTSKEFSCGQEGCTYMVRSTDEGEIVHMVRGHAQNKHGMSISDEDVRKGIAESD
jgi:predicted small metal-binding protein